MFEVMDCAPSVNRAYWFISKGKRIIKVKTTVAKNWIKKVQDSFMEQYPNTNHPIFQDGYVEVSLEFHFTDKRRHDVDNFQKLTLDALTKFIWNDDTQIKKITSEKFESTLTKKTKMRVRKWEENQ